MGPVGEFKTCKQARQQQHQQQQRVSLCVARLCVWHVACVVYFADSSSEA